MFAHAENSCSMSSGRAQGRAFDTRHHVTTQAIAFLSDLDPEVVGDAGAHATHYEPVPPSDFHELLALLDPDEITASAFVDIGCGMGRAVLLASEYPFRQIVGIEVSPALHEVARQNLADAANFATRCRDVRLIRGDGRIAQYPPGPLVAFLYNPFDADALNATVNALCFERDAPLLVLYHTAAEEAVLFERGFVKRGETKAGACYALPSTSRSRCE